MFDKRISFLFSWLLIVLFVINAVEVLDLVNKDIISIFFKGSLVFCFLMCVFSINGHLSKISLLFSIFLVVIFILNYVCFSESNIYFTQTARKYLINVFPFAFIAFYLNDESILIHKLLRASRIVLAFSMLFFVFVDKSTHEYSMGLSNSLTIPIIVLLNNCICSKCKLYDLLLTIFGVLIIVSIGSRGALLGIVAFLVVLFIAPDNKLSKKSFVVRFLVLGVMTILCFLYKKIALGLYIVLSKFGILSRTLWILAFDVNHSSGRDGIYDNLVKAIWREPFTVHGIAAERIATFGAYSHNIVLELLYQFGIMIGSILILVVICFGINNLYVRRNKLLIILFSGSVPLLLVSGTLWESTFFWVWIALNIKSLIRSYNNEATTFEYNSTDKESILLP